MAIYPASLLRVALWDMDKYFLGSKFNMEDGVIGAKHKDKEIELAAEFTRTKLLMDAQEAIRQN